MAARLTLSAGQLRELELALAGAWQPERSFQPPSVSGARLSVRSPLGSGEVVDLLDAEGTEVARITVADVGEGVDERWVSGALENRSPFGHLPFAALRSTSAARPEKRDLAVALTGDAPGRYDSRWQRIAPGVPVVLLDHGDTAALARNVEIIRAVGRQPVVLPAPDATVRSQTEWEHAVEAAARRLVADQIDLWRTERARGDGLVILLTGLSGSGKSTIAKHLAERLAEIDPRKVTLLDGDEVRQVLSSKLGFSREDRELNVRRIGWVASLVSANRGIAICAPIAPYRSMRDEVRARSEAVGGFLLVHVSTPLETCEARDRKGLYEKARRGEVLQFTGISDPYEEPDDADVKIDTASVSIEDAVAQISALVRETAETSRSAIIEYVI